MSEPNQAVVAITKFTVTAEPAEFEQAFRRHAEFMQGQSGFQRAQLVRSARSPEVYVNVGWWDGSDAYLAVLSSTEFRSHLSQFAQLASVESVMGPVLLSLEPTALEGSGAA